MATDRKDTKVTRLDLRIPNDIYAQVEEIAKANNAPFHHITGNIILSPTLLKLISLGIRSLSDNYSELEDISQPSDSISPRIDAIEGEFLEVKKFLTELAGKLSSMIPDTISDTLSDIVSDTLSDTKIVLPESIDQPHQNDMVPTVTLAMPIKYIEPDWMRAKYSKFFRLLTTEEGLLESVIPVFAAFGGSKQLGVELVKIGFKKSDGTPLELSTVSELNRVVKYLNCGVTFDES